MPRYCESAARIPAINSSVAAWLSQLDRGRSAEREVVSWNTRNHQLGSFNKLAKAKSMLAGILDLVSVTRHFLRLSCILHAFAKGYQGYRSNFRFHDPFDLVNPAKLGSKICFWIRRKEHTLMWPRDWTLTLTVKLVSFIVPYQLEGDVKQPAQLFEKSKRHIWPLRCDLSYYSRVV